MDLKPSETFVLMFSDPHCFTAPCSIITMIEAVNIQKARQLSDMQFYLIKQELSFHEVAKEYFKENSYKNQKQKPQETRRCIFISLFFFFFFFFLFFFYFFLFFFMQLKQCNCIVVKKQTYLSDQCSPDNPIMGLVAP